MPYSIMFSKTYARIKAAETRIQVNDSTQLIENTKRFSCRFRFKGVHSIQQLVKTLNVQAQGRCAALSRCVPWSAVLGGIHWFVVINPQPAFYYAVNNPDSVCDKDEPTYNEKNRDYANYTPQQTKPEGSNLPTEVTLQKCSGHIIFLDVVHDDRNYCCDANQKRSRI